MSKSAVSTRTTRRPNFAPLVLTAVDDPRIEVTLRHVTKGERVSVITESDYTSYCWARRADGLGLLKGGRAFVIRKGKKAGRGGIDVEADRVAAGCVVVADKAFSLHSWRCRRRGTISSPVTACWSLSSTRWFRQPVSKKFPWSTGKIQGNPSELGPRAFSD